MVLWSSFSYTLFPLLLLLDAAIECRSTLKADSKEETVTLKEPKAPYQIRDDVAEGVVQCLEQLLKKCHLESVDQVVQCDIVNWFSFLYLVF